MKLPYFIVERPVALLLSIGLFFALWASLDIGSSAYWPTSTLAFISAVFPPISGYTQKSVFPDVTQAYMAVSFMLMPLHVWYGYKELSTPSKAPWFKNLWALDSYWAFIQRATLVLLVFVVVLFTLFLNPGYDFNLMPLNTSRLALGLGGWIVAGGIQGVGLAWIYCNLVVFYRFLRR